MERLGEPDPIPSKPILLERLDLSLSR